MIKLEMKNYKRILIEKQQKYQLYNQATYACLTSEEILPSDQSRKIEQARTS